MGGTLFTPRQQMGGTLFTPHLVYAIDGWHLVYIYAPTTDGWHLVYAINGWHLVYPPINGWHLVYGTLFTTCLHALSLLGPLAPRLLGQVFPIRPRTSNGRIDGWHLVYAPLVYARSTDGWHLVYAAPCLRRWQNRWVAPCLAPCLRPRLVYAFA